jgi:hypothetical protein
MTADMASLMRETRRQPVRRRLSIVAACLAVTSCGGTRCPGTSSRSAGETSVVAVDASVPQTSWTTELNCEFLIQRVPLRRSKFLQFYRDDLTSDIQVAVVERQLLLEAMLVRDPAFDDLSATIANLGEGPPSYNEKQRAIEKLYGPDGYRFNLERSREMIALISRELTRLCGYSSGELDAVSAEIDRLISLK